MDQNEMDKLLFDMQLKCARPSLAFRLMFTQEERNFLGVALSCLMGERQTNQVISKLEKRYGLGMSPSNPATCGAGVQR